MIQIDCMEGGREEGGGGWEGGSAHTDVCLHHSITLHVNFHRGWTVRGGGGGGGGGRQREHVQDAGKGQKEK